MCFYIFMDGYRHFDEGMTIIVLWLGPFCIGEVSTIWRNKQENLIIMTKIAGPVPPQPGFA